MILVTGATGTVGHDVVRFLLEAKASVRAMTRDPAKAKLPAGVEVVRGDFADPASVAAAMQGVKQLFLLAVGPQIPVIEARTVTDAKKAGVEHVVKISTLGAATPNNAIARWHHDGEKAVEASGLRWTHLRPSGFMSNAFAWVPTVKGQGAVYGAMGDVKSAPIHPLDIAAVAAHVLTRGDHASKAYPLTGGELLSMADQMKTLSEVIGKSVKYVDVPDEVLRENMIKAGRPVAVADGVAELQRSIKQSGGASAFSTVRDLLGRAPSSWAQWCKENAAAFQ